MHWLNKNDFAVIQMEGTTAFRAMTSWQAWVDIYGASAVISVQRREDFEELKERLWQWAREFNWKISGIACRILVKQANTGSGCVWIEGQEPTGEELVVCELGVRYRLDFSSGYSCGLFCDQRENRRYLTTLKPKRLLNCFAYTCAFSVMAAKMGAQTCSIDLSRKALEWGKENFVLNDIDVQRHAFYVSDVLRKLPQLARREERFDVIILDPPTFSRGEGGRVFRVEKQFKELIEMAVSCASPRAHLLLSTNHQELDMNWLKIQAKCAIGSWVNAFYEIAPPVDFRRGSAANTVWVDIVKEY